jgi:hypothetical protein
MAKLPMSRIQYQRRTAGDRNGRWKNQEEAAGDLFSFSDFSIFLFLTEITDISKSDKLICLHPGYLI